MPYSHVTPGPVAPFVRRDTRHVTSSAERPTDEEYRRHLWLVDQRASVDFDDERVREIVDFRARDVLFSAVLAASSQVLADLADEFGRPEATEFHDMAARFPGGRRRYRRPAHRPGP